MKKELQAINFNLEGDYLVIKVSVSEGEGKRLYIIGKDENGKIKSYPSKQFTDPPQKIYIAKLKLLAQQSAEFTTGGK